jgi:hypothetical protein
VGEVVSAWYPHLERREMWGTRLMACSSHNYTECYRVIGEDLDSTRSAPYFFPAPDLRFDFMSHHASRYLSNLARPLRWPLG